MCGINCIFDPKRNLADKSSLVSYMNHQMVYRGPDEDGIYGNEVIALGMRRLSIIDLSGGHQPLINEDGSLILICNGEIYNYVELMQALKSRGHQFMSGSDAETILHLYEEKGEKCLEDLRGMFAFILWDTKRQRLFAARDRIGIKPLYMSQQNGVLWLSSELKAIVSLADIAPTLRPLSVYQFLMFGYAIDQRHTVVEEIKRILPGEYLLADASGISLNRYWSPRFGGYQGLADFSDDEIMETLETAVGLHLRSDVPVGILLSGGIDSSTIAALAAKSGSNYTALCAGYTGNEAVDERQQAHATAHHLGLPYQDVILDPEDYGRYYDQLISLCDEPLGDRAAMPAWALYAAARSQGYKVVLSGLGGDELFFGYPTWNDAFEKATILPKNDREHFTAYSHYQGMNAERCRMETLIHPNNKAILSHLDTHIRNLWEDVEWSPDVISAIVFGTYLVHNGCHLADKLGMGCSVEVRVPLLDHILIERVFALPVNRRYISRQFKIYLKQLMSGILPLEVLQSPKRGFTPPIHHLEKMLAQKGGIIPEGVLAKEWLDKQQLFRLYEGQIALPWVPYNRVRRLFGLPRRATEFLFRVLSFERWYAALIEQRNYYH